MSPLPRSLLVVNSGKDTPIPILTSMSELCPFVVTEHRYRQMWPAGVAIACVDNASDPYQVHAAALTLVPAQGFDGAVGLSERTIASAGYVASQLGIPNGYRLEEATRFTNKFAMKQAFAVAGIRAARHHLVPSPTELHVDAWTFPAILKPTIGGGVSGVFVVDSPDALHSSQVIEQLTELVQPRTPSSDRFPLIAEEFLPVDREFHVDALVVGSQVRTIAVSEYLRPVMSYAGGMFGSSTVGDVELRAKLVDLHREVVGACGMSTGVTHFEVLMSGNVLYAGEIAARPGGGGIPLMLQHALGWDTWTSYLQLAAGIEYRVDQPNSAGAEHDEFFAQCMFPLEAGVVEHVSTREQLEGIPGVVEAVVSVRPGQIVGGVRDSSTTSAIVIVSAPSLVALNQVVERVRLGFEVRMSAP